MTGEVLHEADQTNPGRDLAMGVCRGNSVTGGFLKASEGSVRPEPAWVVGFGKERARVLVSM